MSLAGRRFGSYEIQRELGSGGQAVVYLARHVTLDRLDAVKVLNASAHGSTAEGLRQRFQQEGSMAARLEHPNIVSVYDADEVDGLAFIAMQYIAGESLADRIARDGALAREHVGTFLRPLADALDYAHRQGLIHRDIKPANVLIGEDGRVFLTDFGIAKAYGEASGLTQQGDYVGTVRYSAPEQIKGLELTPAADIYAFAVVAFEALTGAPPFSGESYHRLLHAHLEEEPPSPSQTRPDLPAALDPVFATGLAKQPEARQPSASAFVESLLVALGPPADTIAASPGSAPTETVVSAAAAPRPASASPPPSAAPPGPGAPGERPPRRAARNRRITIVAAVAAGVACVALLAVGLLFALGGSDDSSDEDASTTTTEETSDGLSPAEEALVATVGLAPSSCATNENAFAGQVASVTCDATPDIAVTYTEFSSVRRLRAYFESAHPEFSGENCDDPPWEGTWSVDSETRGRIACFPADDGDAQVEWTVDEDMIHGYARSALPIEDVSEWWGTNGFEGTSAS